MTQLPTIAGRVPTIYQSIVTSRFYALDDDSTAILSPDGQWNPCDESRQRRGESFPGCYRDEFTYPTEAAAREFAIEVAGREARTDAMIGRPDKPFHKAECQCAVCREWIAANPAPTLAEPGAKAGCAGDQLIVDAVLSQIRRTVEVWSFPIMADALSCVRCFAVSMLINAERNMTEAEALVDTAIADALTRKE